MPTEEQNESLNNNEEEITYNYPQEVTTKKVVFKQGVLTDFALKEDFVNNTFYTASDAGILRLGNLVYLHSIICLTQHQYDFLQRVHRAINSHILYFIVENEKQSDYNYIAKNLPQIALSNGMGDQIIITPDNYMYYY